MKAMANRIVGSFLFLFLFIGAASADPLPSWNEGPAKSGIVDFVTRVTTFGNPDFVPVEARIATFDNDGTLWAEQPVYFQFQFAHRPGEALAPEHPEWKDQQPFAAYISGDPQAMLAAGEKGLMQIMAVSHSGMTTEAFAKIVADWFATARHPRFNRPYTDLVYQPMQELLVYLRDKGFKTFIVSGGGIEFMRVYTEKSYGIPPEQIVGSAAVTKFQLAADGKPEIMRERQGPLRRRRAGQARGDQHVHRAAADLRFRQFRRRPTDAGMDRRRQWRPLHGPGPSHGCRARMVL